ncbi:MAG: DUF3330 domain-containing protein [Sideroxydans sp.]|nr:DUF3330 domain-containing protein [Sideroxydans sp.]
MTTPNRPENESQKILCSECLKEIPLSAALTPDGKDYIGQFCGIECDEQFVAQNNPDQAEKPNSKNAL